MARRRRERDIERAAESTFLLWLPGWLAGNKSTPDWLNDAIGAASAPPLGYFRVEGVELQRGPSGHAQSPAQYRLARATDDRELNPPRGRQRPRVYRSLWRLVPTLMKARLRRLAEEGDRDED